MKDELTNHRSITSVKYPYKLEKDNHTSQVSSRHAHWRESKEKRQRTMLAHAYAFNIYLNLIRILFHIHLRLQIEW